MNVDAVSKVLENKWIVGMVIRCVSGKSFLYLANRLKFFLRSKLDLSSFYMFDNRRSDFSEDSIATVGALDLRSHGQLVGCDS